MSLETLGSFYQMGRSIRVKACEVDGKYTETLTGTDDEQKAYISAGHAAMSAITSGISAIGQMLTLNDVDDHGITNRKLEQIGYLILENSVSARSCFDTPCCARLLSTNGLFPIGDTPFALSSPRSGRIEGFCDDQLSFLG